MNAILRTSLIGVTTLILTAMPAFAQDGGTLVTESRKIDVDALHAAQKALDSVLSNIRVLEARINEVRREISELKGLYFASGEAKYKAEIESRMALVARLEHRLAELNRMADGLRAKIAKLSPAPVVTDMGGTESTGSGAIDQPSKKKG